MPKVKSAYQRFRVIDRCLNDRRHPYPTLEYLANQCTRALGTPISTSTIEKDIAFMRRTGPDDFDAPIAFNRFEKGYYYAEVGFSIASFNLDEEEWIALRYAAHLLYQYADVPLFKDFKQAIEKINTRFELQLNPEDQSIDKYVLFESAHSCSGYQWISEIYSAIRDRHLILFSYENIYKKTIKSYSVQPVLLREHRNRWYMIVWSSDRNDYLTFALDRIKSLQIISEKQRFRQDFDPSLFLKHSIGIMESSHVPEKVSLIIRSPYDRLLKLEPLHPSQMIVEESDNQMHIQLDLHLNEELYHRILGYGPYCEVLEPECLRNTVSVLLKKSIQQYSRSD